MFVGDFVFYGTVGRCDLEGGNFKEMLDICDKNGYIMGTVVTAGNIHDSVAFDELYDELNETISLLENYQGETNDNYQLAFGANEFNRDNTRYHVVAYDYGYSTKDIRAMEIVLNQNCLIFN